MESGELALVAWLQQRFKADATHVPIGIGDDMAIVRFGESHVAITADMLLDGVHFDTRRHSYEQIGRKAVACSLSDCAAMGCRPRAATISVALNRSMRLSNVQALYEGMAGIAGQFGCAIVGGDTTSWDRPLALDVAMLGAPMHPRGPIRRSTAQPGDIIFVSGLLGGSILGRHLNFEPRLDLAARLVTDPGLNAMMDISDGLALDLHRLCTASGCDAELDEAALEAVISPQARQLATSDGQSPLEHALSDGEDFELLFTGRKEFANTVTEVRAIGRIMVPAQSGQSQIRLVGRDGTVGYLEPRGYEHNWS